MPRTLAQNAQYIAETIKPAIKSAIEAQGVTVPSTDSFLDYADRIAEIEGGGSGYQLKDLPTGAISTVNDAAPLPLNALKVSVEAWQEGTGDPSPSNIRPIHGWDSGEITVSDDIQSPTQTETTSLNFPTTIYGAEWDVVGGVMNEGYGFEEFNSSNGFLQSSVYLNVFDKLLTNKIAPISDDAQSTTCTCNQALVWEASSGDAIANRHYISIQRNNNNADGYISVRIDGTTLNDLNDYLQASPVQLKYKLNTPQPIPLSPLSIRMLQGTNNLYADCGEVIEGEYFVDEGAIDVRKVDYSIGSSGSIKTTDGRVLSGFASMSGYHARPLDASGSWLDVDWSKDWEIGIAFKLTSFSANQAIFASADANRELVPTILWVASDGSGQNQIRVLVSSDGSSWAVTAITSFVPVIDTFYFLKMIYNASTKALVTQVTSDFTNWTTIESDTMSASPYYSGAGTAIGGRGGSSSWATNNLLIDTFNTYIKGDGVNWGAFTGAFPS